jgi:cell division transport system permease protein
MRPWLAAHAYSLRRALVRLGARPAASVLETVVLAIALALPLALMLVVENVRALAAAHPATPEISLYLSLDASPADRERIGEQLRRLQGADAVRFVSRAEAYERLRQSAALAEVLEALPANPLPDAYTVRVRAADANRLEALAQELSAWPQVAKVQVDSQWAQRLDALVRLGRAAAGGLALVFAAAMVTITFNTVRLQLLQQREEIDLSRLIGATDAFLRRPYLYFGALQGLLGAATALALVAASHVLAARELAAISVVYGISLDLQPVPPALVGGVLGVGAGLGYAAAWISVATSLRAR